MTIKPPILHGAGGTLGAVPVKATDAATGYGTKPTVDGLVMERLLNPKYFTHFERFLELPQLNATIDQVYTVEAARACYKHLELLGTNATAADVTFLPGGGIRCETVGADADGDIILAHLDAGPVTALAGIGWSTARRPLFMANLVSGPDAADVTSCILWAGWKLTNTHVTATDADQCFFRFEDDVNGGRWQAVTSVANSDSAIDTGITVRSATNYRLVIDVDINRVPRFYVNGALVSTGAAMTSLATLEFYIGVEADGAAEAKQLDIRNFMVSQLYA